ncbi:hypothetical protein BH11MYX1_BH11MYX1_32840 [soil metagenome]
MVRSEDGELGPTLTAVEVNTELAESTDTIPASPKARASAGKPTVAGYEVGEVIGKGGMGEVFLARDAKIGRDVAIKRMHSSEARGDAVDRFLREARIQAQLDHPAIVPVHALGEDAEGRPYFTMKRLAGRTLHEVLGEASQQKLLRAFVDVCLAVEFAHARGVVHRDLKPSNIVLGDYGEVYVLDWGIARVLGDHPDHAAGDTSTLEGHTEAGTMLGTPGYMAPEQIRGDGDVGVAADVYALGSILFEILTGEPLHPPGNGAIASTLAGACDAPLVRRPDRSIAPELDLVCADALVADPRARPAARDLVDRVQRFLDGDRDLAQRRKLAADNLTLVRELLDDPARRAEAVRLAGHALVLDPESTQAAALVMSLMIEPPTVLPRELQLQLREREIDLGVRAARHAVWAPLTYLLFLPVVIWSGGVNWPLIAGSCGLVLMIVAMAVYQARHRRPSVMPTLLLNAALMVMLSRMLGPFILIPGIIGMFSASLIALPEIMGRPWVVIGVGLLAWLTPIVLEAAGVLGHTWRVVEGAIVVSSGALHLGGTPTLVLLIGSNLALIVVTGLFGRSIAASRADAQRRGEIQAWHLRQLLPIMPPQPRIEIPAAST